MRVPLRSDSVSHPPRPQRLVVTTSLTHYLTREWLLSVVGRLRAIARPSVSATLPVIASTFIGIAIVARGLTVGLSLLPHRIAIEIPAMPSSPGLQPPRASRAAANVDAIVKAHLFGVA